MNKINNLLDEKFLKKFFTKRVLPLYPDFIKIKKIKVIPHKKYIWDSSYHVIFEYQTFFINQENKIRIIPIFCTAHSAEPRLPVFKSLEFLWNHGFNKGYLSIPHPLFYSKTYNATFYRGVEGINLYQYIREKNYNEIKKIIPKTAAWFSKLHNISPRNAPNFNKANSRIKTVYPGVEHILSHINNQYPQYFNVYKKMYGNFINNEEKYLKKIKRRWLVHGDAHPENIIKMSEKKIGVIDFTDLSLSDFARDIGTFTQQFEYMAGRKIDDPKFCQKMIKLFKDNYFKLSGIKLDEEVKKRIDNYHNWTTIRTATFFLLNYKPEPERAAPLIKTVCEKLNINI